MTASLQFIAGHTSFINFNLPRRQCNLQSNDTKYTVIHSKACPRIKKQPSAARPRLNPRRLRPRRTEAALHPPSPLCAVGQAAARILAAPTHTARRVGRRRRPRTVARHARLAVWTSMQCEQGPGRRLHQRPAGARGSSRSNGSRVGGVTRPMVCGPARCNDQIANE
jgi:hypothetical protein